MEIDSKTQKKQDSNLVPRNRSFYCEVIAAATPTTIPLPDGLSIVEIAPSEAGKVYVDWDAAASSGVKNRVATQLRSFPAPIDATNVYVNGTVEFIVTIN